MSYCITRKIRTILLAGIILVLTGCVGSEKQASTGEHIDDTVITTKVKAELFDLDGFESFDISVETFKGNVQLSGFVDTEAQRQQAEVAANRVEGIKSINNSIVVKP